jgi:two-component system cell cycle sensor histidine kinase/response regulator CckA
MAPTTAATGTTIPHWPRKRRLLALTAISAVLFVVDLFLHGAETWMRLLDLVDGPLFATAAIWGVVLLRKARHEARSSAAIAEEEVEKRRRFFLDAPVALFRTRPDGTILEANPATHQLLGVPETESLVGGSTIDWYVNPAERQEVLARVRSDSPEPVVVNLRRRDGQSIWVACRCRAITEPGGAGPVFEGALLDVTERRRATERLRAQERHYRALIEKSADGVTLFTRDLEVTYRSPGALALLGVQDPIRSIGGTCFERVYPDDQPKFFELVREVLDRPGATWSDRVRLRRDDGSAFWADVRLTNLLDDPDVASVVINFRDVSARVEAEQKQCASEERFREFAEHIQESFFVTEPDGRVSYVSPTWSKIWGRPPAEGLDPKIWFDAIHPEDRAVVAATQELVRSGQADEATFRVLRPDGSIRWVRGRAYPVRDASGAVIRIVGVSEDVTQLRHAEEQFNQAQKLEAVARLAGGVAHDFNNLLTVMMAEADFALRCSWIDAEVKESLENIRGASEQAAGLTKQLLLFSRRQGAEPVTFDLNDVVADTGKLLRRVIGEDVSLIISTNSQAAMVRADKGQIQQVITNLAVNARDAMPIGGHLIIGTAVEDARAAECGDARNVKPGRYATITVEDSGCGMTRDVLEHAFEPFFTTKERGKGTGLGLASCYGIVKEAGGEVRVTSAVGVGTIFTIYLPLVQSEAHAEAPPASVPWKTMTRFVASRRIFSAIRGTPCSKQGMPPKRWAPWRSIATTCTCSSRTSSCPG